MTTALPTTALWIEAATRLISSCSFAGSRSSSAFHHSSKCYLPLQTIGNVITAKSALRPPQTPILARSAFGPRTPMVAKCTVNGHENSPRTATEFPRYGHFISPDMATEFPRYGQQKSPRTATEFPGLVRPGASPPFQRRHLQGAPDPTIATKLPASPPSA